MFGHSLPEEYKFRKISFWWFFGFEHFWVGKHDAAEEHVDQNGYIQELNREVWNNATECIRLLVILEEHGLVAHVGDEEVHKADKIYDGHATRIG